VLKPINQLESNHVKSFGTNTKLEDYDNIITYGSSVCELTRCPLYKSQTGKAQVLINLHRVAAPTMLRLSGGYFPVIYN